MPPERENHADPNQVLAYIYYVVEARRASVGRQLEEWRLERRRQLTESWKQSWNPRRDEPRPEIYFERGMGSPPWYLLEADDGWIEYSLEGFAGEDDLSDSEKQVWRRAVRQLSRDGLVETRSRAAFIRLTDKGRERAASLPCLRARVIDQLSPELQIKILSIAKKLGLLPTEEQS